MSKNKIVIGTWPLSGDLGAVALSSIEKILLTAYDHGLREFDTAPSYGNGFMEFCMGKVFKNKKDVKINTKAGNIPFKGKSFNIENIKKSVEQSLKRLNIKRINVLFLHNPRKDVESYGELIRFLEELKSSGIIEHTGLSMAKGFDYKDHVNLMEFDYIQNDVNLIYTEPLSIDSKIKLMARSPLASGILSGKLTEETTFPSDDQRSGWLKGERLHSILKRVRVLKELSDRDLPSLARGFVLSEERIDKVIFGVKKISHVEDLVNDIENIDFPKKLSEKIKELNKEDFYLKNERHLGY